MSLGKPLLVSAPLRLDREVTGPASAVVPFASGAAFGAFAWASSANNIPR